MSPRMLRALAASEGFPRVSGDEPVLEFARLKESTFSPRERG